MDLSTSLPAWTVEKNHQLPEFKPTLRRPSFAGFGEEPMVERLG